MWLIRLITKLTGQKVGADAYGNVYYQHKPIFLKRNAMPRRWVIYKDRVEASLIPAEWHGWLHHTHPAPLTRDKYSWQKVHQMNLTGTPHAYRPVSSLSKNFKSTAYQRFEPWQPDDTDQQ